MGLSMGKKMNLKETASSSFQLGFLLQPRDRFNLWETLAQGFQATGHRKPQALHPTPTNIWAGFSRELGLES